MTRKTDIRSFSARYLSLRRVPLLLLIDTVRRLECENSVGRPIKIVVNSSQELRFVKVLFFLTPRRHRSAWEPLV